ncbi:transposase [Actinopolymorpha pittospori]|uniref:transposase n=1 Tax=Actinopolymorpha pittospori TaxID=648752 RepID=UPI00178A7221
MKRSKGSSGGKKARRGKDGSAGGRGGVAGPRFRVSSDGHGLASHAGVSMLRELAEFVGLTRFVTQALADTYRGPWLHSPGQVFADQACAIADGARATSGIAVLRDRPQLHGAVASQPTVWRLVDRIDEQHLGLVRQARAKARERAWQAGAAPDLEATGGYRHIARRSSGPACSRHSPRSSPCASPAASGSCGRWCSPTSRRTAS